MAQNLLSESKRRIMEEMKHEYHEGPKAGENFVNLARAVFQTPEAEVPKKQRKAKPARRKRTKAERRQ
jgi:hypothetical protein